MSTEENISDIELDDNDKKIIQLYEVINELIEEQKARTNDLTKLLKNENEHELLTNLEERNDSLLQQIYSELELNEKKDDNNNNESDEDNNDDDDDDDESDEGWEIYNSVVLNLNNYMTKIAEFTQKLKEDKEIIESMESNDNNPDESINELELIISKQTIALSDQTKRNNELENALSNVLNEYSNRINLSNDEITKLHSQLSNQNNLHQNQLKQLRNMYENKIKQLENTTAAKFENEINGLLNDLENNRNEYTKEIQSLTNDIATTQEKHHKEILKLNRDKQRLIKALADKNSNNNNNNNNNDNSFNIGKYIKERIEKIKNSLKCERTKLDIDYGIVNTSNNNDYNLSKQKRTYSSKSNFNDSITPTQQMYYSKYKKYNKYG